MIRIIKLCMKKFKQELIILGDCCKIPFATVPLVIMLLLQLSWAPSVLAHEGYITTYNHHIVPGELELMIMNDFTSPSDPKRKNDGHEEYFSQMLELEYAPTDQLAFEFMAEAFEDIGKGETKFTGFRYETRYRLFKDEVPLNPMLYLEYEDLHINTRYKMEVSGWVEPPYEEEGEEPDRERILESRLILSQDFWPWNVAFNWINESDLNSGGTTAFGYSFGLLYRLPMGSEEKSNSHHGEHIGNKEVDAPQKFIQPASLAFEFLGALGDTKKFDLRPSRQEHYFQPSIMFHVGDKAMLTIGFGIGLTKASDNMIRTNLGWMF